MVEVVAGFGNFAEIAECDCGDTFFVPSQLDDLFEHERICTDRNYKHGYSLASTTVRSVRLPWIRDPGLD